MPFCIKCGSSYDIGSKKCSLCGETLPNNDIENKSQKTNEETHNNGKSRSIPSASISKRLLAGILDIFIGIGSMVFIIYFVLIRFFAKKALFRGYLAIIIIYALAGLYILVRDCLKGKSFGKMIFGLTTVNIEKRKEADLGDSILRNAILASIVVPVIGWIVFIISSVIIAIQIGTGKEQRIGDAFAKTKVIEDKFLNAFVKAD